MSRWRGRGAGPADSIDGAQTKEKRENIVLNKDGMDILRSAAYPEESELVALIRVATYMYTSR